MTDELKQRAERAVADLESAAEMLRSSYFSGLVEAALEKAVVAATSPWLDREAAGAYCRCHPSEIDRQADAGTFKRHMRGGKPLFDKNELDEAIRSGAWKKRKELAEAA